MKPIVNPLAPGAVIRTHPWRGYWGCAVVLTARDGTSDMYPCCHIAVTALIRKRKYSWSDIGRDELRIVRMSPSVRIGPQDYRKAPKERTCIGIYTLRRADTLDIIGHIEPAAIYADPLTYDVGDGSDGAYPLCGPIKEGLGWEAVAAWREIHDQENFERERRVSREQFEVAEAKRLTEQRTKRRLRGGA